MVDFLPAGVSPEDFLTLLAGFTAFMTMAAIWYGLLDSGDAARRARELASNREALKAGFVATKRRAQAPREISIGFMRQVVNKLNLQRTRQVEHLANRMAKAGWRSRDAVIAYQFFKVVSPFIVGALAIFALYVVNIYHLSPPARLIAVVAAVGFGFYLPDIIVKNQSDKRALAIQRALPDALDLMVICAEAGLSLDATLKRVSEEFSMGSSQLADELSFTALELGFLPDRRQALQNLANRTGSPSVRSMISNLLQADKYGTPVAHSLRVLSSEFREERMLKAEEKAARLPALLTVPMICFILPPLFVVLIGVGMLRIYDALHQIVG